MLVIRGAAGDGSAAAVEQMLVGDSDRQDVDERLQRAVGDGFLTLVEYDGRARTAWSARTRGELARVTTDLPVDRTPRRGARRIARDYALPRWPVQRIGVAAGLAALLAAELLVMHHLVNDGLDDEPLGQEQYASLIVHRVSPDQRRLDLDQFTEEVTVVVPDGMMVDLSAVSGQGTLSCERACHRRSGPVLRVRGHYIDDFIVMTRSEAQES